MIEPLLQVRARPLPSLELVPDMGLNERYFDAIQQVMGDVSLVLPEFVGMTIFGSLSRNEAKVKDDGTVSDVDGVVVIDADKSNILTEFITSVIWQKQYAVLERTMLGMKTKVHMQDLIDQTASTGAHSDIDLLLVSNRQLLEIPNYLLQDTPEPESTVTDWSDVDDSVKVALRYFVGRDHPAGLFFPGAYGDTQKYRNMALQPLAKYRDDKPQITERIWHNIRYYTDSFREGREKKHIPTDLPENIDEALQEYKVS